MGATCCGGKGKTENDTNLMRNRSKKDKNFKMDDKVMAGLPISTIVKMQAMMRGFLARKKIKKVYGYEMTPGLLNRGTVHIEMDPEKLEE